MNNEAPPAEGSNESLPPFQLPPSIKIKTFVRPLSGQGFTKDELNDLLKTEFIPWLEPRQPDFCSHIFVEYHLLKQNLFTKEKIGTNIFKTFVYKDENANFTEQELHVLFHSGHIPWTHGTTPNWKNYTLISLDELIQMTIRRQNALDNP